MNGLDFGTAIGLIKGLGSPDPAVIESAVSDWLDDHPEATTTVQDGSITKAKLDSNLQGTVDDVADLKSAINHITPEMTTFVTGGSLDENGNLCIENNPTLGAYFNDNNGIPTSNQHTTNYLCTDFIKIEPNNTYQLKAFRPTESSISIYNYCLYDTEKQYIANSQSGNYPKNFYSDNANFVRICLRGANETYGNGVLVVIKGNTSPTQYIEPTYLPIELPGSDYATKQYVDEHIPAVDSKPKLKLPERYELVVGDKFQLFWKGVIDAVDYLNYYLEVVCDIGRSFKRFFEYTPVAGDIGTHTMTVKLYDNGQNKLDEKTVKLIVKAKATSPASEKVVLYVTDSLGNSGYVPDEFNRRLVGTGGSPAGDGLSNITFIGTNVSVNRGIKYIGNGGWNWTSYNSSMISNRYMWVNVSSHDKTIGDQHSIYEDSVGGTWKLETIEASRIKIIRVSGETALPASGTLTWVSGGENHSDIVYSSSEMAAGNPLWDTDANKISFANFVEEQGESSLDYVYVLLGWNTASSSESSLKSGVRTFINNCLADYPNCKIVILGLEIPAMDGLAYNYGQNEGVLSSYRQSMNHVFNLNKWYAEIAQELAYANNVSFVNIAGQFDTEYNMPTATMKVNVRNATTETFQRNGVHPAESGYYQIADACYRDFVHKLQE